MFLCGAVWMSGLRLDLLGVIVIDIWGPRLRCWSTLATDPLGWLHNPPPPPTILPLSSSSSPCSCKLRLQTQLNSNMWALTCWIDFYRCCQKMTTRSQCDAPNKQAYQCLCFHLCVASLSAVCVQNAKNHNHNYNPGSNCR